MSWLKGSDKAATFPKALNVPHFSKGEISVNEMFGFIHRCAYESAAHRTDYVIEYGVAMMMGGPNYERLLEVAEQAGLMEQVETDGAPSWKIIEDPDFIHLITKAEQEWMNQQKKDSRDTKLTSAVRFRDGDACRYCLKIVYFGADRKSARAGSYTRIGTFDHVISGEAATLETLVVACGECNSKKKDNDDALELQPAPSEPFYSASTAAWLAKHGHNVTPSAKHPALKKKTTKADGQPSAPRPVEQPTPAAPGSIQATEAASGPASSTDDTPGNGGTPAATENQPDRKPREHGAKRTSAPENQPDPAGHLPDGSRSVGSGHGTGHGSGSAGKGSQPPSKPAQPSKNTRRRRPRSRGRN